MQYWRNIRVRNVGSRNRLSGAYDRPDDVLDSHRQKVRHQPRRPRYETYSNLLAAGEQSLSHLDVTRHSDTLVALQRFTEQLLCFFAITCGGAIDQHRGVKAA
jgi:hypothetical protein